MTVVIAKPEFAVHCWDFDNHCHVDVVCADLATAEVCRDYVRRTQDASALLVSRIGSAPFELYVGGAA